MTDTGAGRAPQTAAEAMTELDFGGLRATFVNCTLKRSPERSHTQGLVDVSAGIMRAHGVDVREFRAVDHDIATGVYVDMTEHGWDRDEWPTIFAEILESDILVLAGPIFMGGMLWGLGQALLEGARMEPGWGRWTANDLGEYLVPVNADAPDVRVEFVEVTDEVVNPLGVKGVGEIGQVGAAAAIANAVFHATGRRIRELPMSPELVMDPIARS